MQKKKKVNLDLKIYNEDLLDVSIPFKRRTDVLVNIIIRYYDTVTQKQETIEFHDYYDHVKRFGFTWEYAPMKLRYEIILSADEKTLPIKTSVPKNVRRQITADTSRMILGLKTIIGGKLL